VHSGNYIMIWNVKSCGLVSICLITQRHVPERLVLNTPNITGNNIL